MEWLKSGLESSTARFKIIFNSVPITDFYDLLGDVESIDRWQGFPEQRSEILSHIEESNINGVLWVSGDFHFGLISQVSPLGQSGDSMLEVLVGPSGSFLNIMGELLVTTDQYQQRIAAWCHTRFECNPATGEILIQYILDDGTIGMERRLEV
jgi:phosphodiesterase/alkaline phosphatase D-like protein